MAGEGVTFENATYSHSLCCPSRVSMLRGQYPHNTGVWANYPPNGGFSAYHLWLKPGEEEYYDLVTDPYQLDNILAGGQGDTDAAEMRRVLDNFASCSGQVSCQDAGLGR